MTRLLLVETRSRSRACSTSICRRNEPSLEQDTSNEWHGGRFKEFVNPCVGALKHFVPHCFLMRSTFLDILRKILNVVIP